jgi:hypothetical protein
VTLDIFRANGWMLGQVRELSVRQHGTGWSVGDDELGWIAGDMPEWAV